MSWRWKPRVFIYCKPTSVLTIWAQMSWVLKGNVRSESVQPMLGLRCLNFYHRKWENSTNRSNIIIHWGRTWTPFYERWEDNMIASFWCIFMYLMIWGNHATLFNRNLLIVFSVQLNIRRKWAGTWMTLRTLMINKTHILLKEAFPNYTSR